MNIKHLILGLVFALFLVPGIVGVARAQDSEEPTLESLQTLIDELTVRVDELKDDLEYANDKIASLEDQVKDLEAIGDDGDSDDGDSGDDRDDEDDNSDITGDGTGHIVLCHKGKNTISVGVSALKAHLAHGDKTGVCGSSTGDDADDDES